MHGDSLHVVVDCGQMLLADHCLPDPDEGREGSAGAFPGHLSQVCAGELGRGIQTVSRVACVFFTGKLVYLWMDVLGQVCLFVFLCIH